MSVLGICPRRARCLTCQIYVGWKKEEKECIQPLDKKKADGRRKNSKAEHMSHGPWKTPMVEVHRSAYIVWNLLGLPLGLRTQDLTSEVGSSNIGIVHRSLPGGVLVGAPLLLPSSFHHIIDGCYKYFVDHIFFIIWFYTFLMSWLTFIVLLVQNLSVIGSFLILIYSLYRIRKGKKQRIAMSCWFQSYIISYICIKVCLIESKEKQRILAKRFEWVLDFPWNLVKMIA
jgi:hypothetical protein